MLRAFGRVLTSRARQQRLIAPLLASDVCASLDSAGHKLQPALAGCCAAPQLCRQAQVSPLGYTEALLALSFTSALPGKPGASPTSSILQSVSTSKTWASSAGAALEEAAHVLTYKVEVFTGDVRGAGTHVRLLCPSLPCRSAACGHLSHLLPSCMQRPYPDVRR